MHNKWFIIIMVHLYSVIYAIPNRWCVTNQVFCFLCSCLSGCRCVKKSEELVINAVATINNLSYYQGESSVVRSQHTHISQCKMSVCVWTQSECCICLCPSVISPSLLSFCHCSATKALAELQYGCCFGGHTCFWKSVADQRRETLHHAAQRFETFSLLVCLSQIPQRLTLYSYFYVSVEQFVVTLLDSKTPDVCFSACGVLINLSADPDNRAALRVEGTIQK